MIPSQGRKGFSGRPTLAAALVTSALGLLASPAMACHLSHDRPSPTSTGAVGPPSIATMPAPPISPPTAHLDQQSQPEPQLIAPPTAASLPMPQVGTPALQAWQQAMAIAIMPPAPTSAPGAASPTVQARGVGGATPLNPPAAYHNGLVPMPAPEPSTIASGLALAAAFAWRRRGAHRRP